MKFRIVSDRGGTPLAADRLWTVTEEGSLVHFEYPEARWAPDGRYRSIWRYHALLPVDDPAHFLSLGEGATPLVPSRLALGCAVCWKNETGNPSGSMKDRALAVAQAVALEHGVRRSIIASAGSAGLAAAVYAARAGLRNIVLLPQGTPSVRVQPLVQLGSTVLEVAGELDRIIASLAELCAQFGYYNVSTHRSGNPYQFEGPKTLAYELYEQWEDVPDWIVAPIGGGGTLAGLWRGLKELKALGLLKRLPRLIGVQAHGFDALARAFAQGGDWRAIGETLPYPAGSPEEALCAKLTHTVPPDGDDAWAAVTESGGRCEAAGGMEALEAQGELAATDGILAEPSSTLLIPVLRRLCREGIVGPGERVIGVITGSGFRELNVMAAYQEIPSQKLAAHEVRDHLARLAEEE